MARLTGNKGEWSEIYVLFKLLADGKIYAADEFLRKNPEIYFPILKIIRDESKNKHCEYIVDTNHRLINIFLNSDKVLSLPPNCFLDESKYLLEKIKESANAFSIEKIENFMGRIYCDKIKAPASDKSDICIQLHDVKTGYSPICGFSIKSELGNQPTLLNASEATNFKFEITGLSPDSIDKINHIKTKAYLHDRFKAICENCKDIKFTCVKNSNFGFNLCFIDTKMAEIVALSLLYRFKYETNDIKFIVNKLEENNPLMFQEKGLYEYKYKKFLSIIALGMKPAKKWDGLDEATGGYIIISDTGDVLVFYLYNRNNFENYLFNNTVFESASASRHNYGYLYKEDNKLFFDFNLQIRFKNAK